MMRRALMSDHVVRSCILAMSGWALSEIGNGADIVSHAHAAAIVRSGAGGKQSTRPMIDDADSPSSLQTSEEVEQPSSPDEENKEVRKQHEDHKEQRNHARSFTDMFIQGYFSGYFRTLYYSSRNAFYAAGVNQDTVSYGGKIGYNTLPWHGFSAGVSAFFQRGIAHSRNPEKVNSYLAPDLTTIGEAYLQYEGYGLKVVGGNQALDVPFASSYDWRMAPQLYQGISARYGDADNFIHVFKMFRYKSYTYNSFKNHTNYNSDFDAYSSIGNAPSGGFWGAGVGHRWEINPVAISAQGWYQTYQDYAKFGYVEGQVIRSQGEFKPFLALQGFRQVGDGRRLLGHFNVLGGGAQIGLKRRSLTISLGFDRMDPHAGSFRNGVLVTPYAHNVASGPLFAQPLLTSAQDLGGGNAYALNITGAPAKHWFVAGRYSYMDLREQRGTPKIDQSEYLFLAAYSFGGALKGLSISELAALQVSPARDKKYFENRLTLQYEFGGPEN